MNRVSGSLLLLFLLLSLPVIGLASGIATPGIGDWAAGMGGAFRALANDWSAAWWNPAGLAYLEKNEFTAQLLIITPRPEYTPNITVGGYEVGYNNGTEWVPNDRHFSYPNVGAFYKMPSPSSWRVGMAILFPYGLGSHWDLFNPLPGYNNTVPYPRFDHEVHFVVVDLHPTVARELIKDKLSFGAGLSIQNGDLAYQRTILVPSSTVPGIGQSLPRPYDNFVMDSKSELNGWGVGINFGFLLKASSKLNLALSYRTPVNIGMSGHTQQKVYFPSESTLIAQNPAWVPYVGGGTAFNEPDLDMTLKLPSELGLGVALFPSDKFTITADLAFTQWSRFNEWALEYKPGTTTPVLNTPPPKKVVLEWDNVTAFSMGVEYQLRQDWKVRAGYANDPSAVSDASASPLFLDYQDKNRLNIGASHTWEKYEVGYSFEYTSFQDRTVTTYSDSNGDFVGDNYPGSYTSRFYGSHFYFTYRF